ncbi:competence type IV pilus major pilin ComGC [Tepidibacter formicigenes]|uniref:Prepilin-type N-terminal cleavage/methylation domain-containing protein n=1 Tax=Tepidibacter formicigenes DSM 15518 TaxID=1123349 RepID=A0A1M6MH31_9FIRM|nr:type II secretion system protein [Tepidibacter formicigenes]SHJ82650.1 prepilin-type N-terminal cleavage/methylation domain-containing protein [Tepidibacter formicigenes DSM 15518]
MLRAIQKRLRNKKGFTLIELIVVLAVLGIIAAIAVPNFTGVKDSAKRKADELSVKTINKAIQLYIAETDDEDLSELKNGNEAATKSVENMVKALQSKDYLEDDFELNNLGNYDITNGRVVKK